MTHVLITGCNRGIGRAMAEEALRRGWHVSGTLRSGTAPQGVATIPLDVTDFDRLAPALAQLAPLDILINNAGVIGPANDQQHPLSMDFNGFAHTLKVNTLAPLAVAHAALPALRSAASARILTVSSQMAYMGYRKPDRIAYRTSKAAVNKVMQGLATALEPAGIAVANIDPGWVRTDMGGAEADLEVRDVAQGILSVAEGLTLDQTGQFLKWTGERREY